jgi:membrane protease YdiL (CAAX protease family)
MSTLTPTIPSGRLESRSVAPVVEIEQHSVARTVALHWLPGLLALGLYLLTAPWVVTLGFPPEFAAALLTLPAVVILFQMGYLLNEGKRRNGRFSLEGIVLYREPMPIWQYGVFVLLLVAWNAAVYMPLLELTGDWLKNTLYFWAPSWFLAESDFAQYPQNIVLVMALVSIPAYTLFGALEELYFRGYLLPRISRFGVWAPFFNTALFTIYHFDMLQNSVSIFVGFLPIAFLTWRKQNVYLAVIAHAALNLIPTLLGFLPVLMK